MFLILILIILEMLELVVMGLMVVMLLLRPQLGLPGIRDTGAVVMIVVFCIYDYLYHITILYVAIIYRHLVT